MKAVVTCGVSAILLAAAGQLKLEDLPAPVKNTVKAQTQNATLAGLSKEKEGGRTVYEVETKVNGKGRDLMVAGDGTILSIEEETALESIPAPAREAILKQAAGAKVKIVETVTKGSEVSYEATVTGKNGKNREFAVNSDGTPHKE